MLKDIGAKHVLMGHSERRLVLFIPYVYEYTLRHTIYILRILSFNRHSILHKYSYIHIHEYSIRMFMHVYNMPMLHINPTLYMYINYIVSCVYCLFIQYIQLRVQHGHMNALYTIHAYIYYIAPCFWTMTMPSTAASKGS